MKTFKIDSLAGYGRGGSCLHCQHSGGSERQVDLCELKDSLVYIVSSRTT